MKETYTQLLAKVAHLQEEVQHPVATEEMRSAFHALTAALEPVIGHVDPNDPPAIDDVRRALEELAAALGVDE